MKIAQFDAPADLTDLTGDAALIKAWSDLISALFDAGMQRTQTFLQAAPGQFYNPKKTDTDEPHAEKVISWPGFPRVIAIKHGNNKRAAYQEAETLVSSGSGKFRPQDEYLEWHATEDPASGKIKRLDLTCEGPEYWRFLATRARATLVALYKQHVSAAVQEADLFDQQNRYNPLNKWNTTDGAMHLTHPSNSLAAEVFIAADATILRQQHGQLLTDADALIQCAQYGEPERASDPRIGAEVNALARRGFALTLKNPVGLYMDRLNTTGWTKPDGTPVGDYLKITRGQAGQAVHAVYEVPATEKSGGQPFVVGDILIGGKRIEFGGQVAELITMKLTGIACREGQINSRHFGCGTTPTPPTITAEVSDAGIDAWQTRKFR